MSQSLMTALNCRKAWKIPGLLAFCALVVVAAQPADAQSNRDMNNRLSRIENELETLNRAVYKGETPPPGSYSGDSGATSADTEVRLQQMETDLRSLSGKLEEQAYEIRQLREQLERALSDIEMRLGNAPPATAGGVQPGYAGTSAYDSGVSSYGAGSDSYAGASASSPPNPAPHENTAPYASQSSAASAESGDYQWSSSNGGPPGSKGQLGTLTTSGSGATTGSADAAAAQYENAFAMLKNGQHDAAATEFEAFIANNPDHVLISNAKYWLGETYYVRGDFSEAARMFAEGYQQYPKGSKAADNLLKLGLSLAGLGNKDDACVALGQIEKDFPAGAAPVLRRAEQEKSRLGCAA